MGMVITTDIFCDECGDWLDGVTSSKVQAKKVRNDAIKQGWKHIKKDGKLIDVCPVCYKLMMDSESDE